MAQSWLALASDVDAGRGDVADWAQGIDPGPDLTQADRAAEASAAVVQLLGSQPNFAPSPRGD